MLFASVTSMTTGNARPPLFWICSANAISLSSRLAPMATLAPCLARTCAKCAPSPLEAPVTSATRPSRVNRSVIVPALRPDLTKTLRLFAEHELLDLAGRCLGQRAEHHVPWCLEMRHVHLAELDDLLGRAFADIAP